MSERLIIFTRYPEPGKTKTRLVGALGPEGAADLQREMTRHTLRWASELTRARPVSVEVRFEGGSVGLMQRGFGSEFPFRPQEAGDLGWRICRAFDAAFREGIRRTVIVGSDCPGVTRELAGSAFDRLRRTDVVLGPANDGGYYLVGLSRRCPKLFVEIPWGGSAVLRRTLRAAEDQGLTTSLLTPLDDVDRPEDLAAWERVKNSAPGADSRISIVIPALDEAASLEETLGQLPRAEDVEIIVVDAGSRDATVQIARQQGARVIQGVQGRAQQMNAGARAATGGLLLFLHADTRLPDGFDERVRQTLARPGVVAGAFELRIDGANGSLKIIQRAANWRSQHLQMPYGDQALFFPAAVFRDAGGFPDLPIMEDFELVRRLRRRGRIEIVTAAALTSGRRWRRLGPWRTTWINQLTILGYFLGVSPARLACWYGRRESGRRTPSDQ